ncbi:MAG TPA: hypothetical protein VMA33_04040 [Candidatus Tectomicrobia bacterium]|nr:hypothetical protein [Candidatus Tectomicrobia bacterium]
MRSQPFAKHLEIGADYLAPPFARALPFGDCAYPFLPAQTPSLFVGDVIICAVLAVLSAVPIPAPTRKAGRPAAGAQIIT